MESYYMITGDETARYVNGSVVDDENIDLFVKKAEEKLISTTILWGTRYKNELVNKMIQYGVSAIARNTYQFIYPYCTDDDEFAFIVIHFNLVPCKEIRIIDKGITVICPQLWNTELNGPIEIDGMKIPFTVTKCGEFIRLFPSYRDCIGQTTKDTKDYFIEYQTWIWQISDTANMEALKDYNVAHGNIQLDSCLEAVYDAMNSLKMKLSERNVSNEKAVRIWTEIVKNIQESYCQVPLNLEISTKSDSDFMVDENAAGNIKVPKKETKKPEKEPVKMTKEEILDEFLKKSVAATGLPPELLDFVDLKKGRSSHIVPVSIGRPKTPENWKEMGDSIKEHNEKQQPKNSHTVVVEPTPFLDLLMDVLGSHQTDVDD